MEQKCFSWDLNVDSVKHSLVHLGSEFQIRGAAELKERILLLLRVRGTTSCVVSDEDRSARKATLSSSSSAKYDG